MDFIVGIVSADNGTSFPVKNGNEEALWLYFFNDPAQNRISFGRGNRVHFNNLERNYYGNFFDKIESKYETFELRGIPHPVIDLLQESGLLETVKNTYIKQTPSHRTDDKIPALLTFSSSIGDYAREKTIGFIKNYGFQIEASAVPLAELTGNYALKNERLQLKNGDVAILLEATNSTLHLKKLSFADNAFKMDRRIQQECKGKGFDSRKQALLRFVVSQVSRTTYSINNEDELLAECKRFEMQSEEWLQNINSSRHNVPFNIQGISLSKMPNATRNVLVTKANLDADTIYYTKVLKDVFEAFRDDNVSGDVVAVFFLGDCFQTELVKNTFMQMYSEEKLFFYPTMKIHDILEMYLKIDFAAVGDEEAKIRIAKDFSKKAFDLKIEGKLSEALDNIKKAFELDSENREYKQLLEDLNKEIKEKAKKAELYQEYLISGDKYLENKNLLKALEKYNEAKKIDWSSDIVRKIEAVEQLYENCKRHRRNGNNDFESGDFAKAIEEYEAAIEIDNTDSEIDLKLKEAKIKIKTAAPKNERKTYENGDWAEGTFIDGKLHGFGSFYYAEAKRKDTGEFEHGRRIRKGKMEWDDGDWYSGEWDSKGANGQGEYHYADGSWKKGTFVDSTLYGFGSYYDAKSKRTDTGEYENGNRIGKGKIEWEDGDWYYGEWNNKGINGKGEYHFSNGNWEKGTFLNGKLHGFGTFYSAKAKRTDTGEFKNGERTGNGKQEMSDRTVYEGAWNDEDGVFKGTIKSPDEGKVEEYVDETALIFNCYKKIHQCLTKEHTEDELKNAVMLFNVNTLTKEEILINYINTDYDNLLMSLVEYLYSQAPTLKPNLFMVVELIIAGIKKEGHQEYQSDLDKLFGLFEENIEYCKANGIEINETPLQYYKDFVLSVDDEISNEIFENYRYRFIIGSSNDVFEFVDDIIDINLLARVIILSFSEGSKKSDRDELSKYLTELYEESQKTGKLVTADDLNIDMIEVKNLKTFWAGCK